MAFTKLLYTIICNYISMILETLKRSWTWQYSNKIKRNSAFTFCSTFTTNQYFMNILKRKKHYFKSDKAFYLSHSLLFISLIYNNLLSYIQHLQTTITHYLYHHWIDVFASTSAGIILYCLIKIIIKQKNIKFWMNLCYVIKRLV